jgi:hypothetical protein
VNTVIVTIQAGNSDDKLSQIRWSGMIKSINYAVNLWAKEVHFSGFSLPDAYCNKKCALCYGSGKIKCLACINAKGLSYLSCARCKGTRYIDCTNCSIEGNRKWRK